MMVPDDDNDDRETVPLSPPRRLGGTEEAQVQRSDSTKSISISSMIRTLGLTLVVALLGYLALAAEHQSTPRRRTETSSNRPPLSSLIQGDEIVGDVQFLLDYAIIGFPKTATTTVMRWLAMHSQIETFDSELHLLAHGQAAQAVEALYNDLSSNPNILRGYKSPNDVRFRPALYALQRYWPKTKLVIGLRHPVDWFESWYNFKLRQQARRLIPAEEMVGDLLPDQVFYHVHLANLGKTTVEPDPVFPNRQSISRDDNIELQPLSNPVFLYEFEQLTRDRNATRHDEFKRAFAAYLELDEPLGPVVDEIVNETRAHNYDPIDICHYRYRPLRHDLVRVGTAAADWIVAHLLPQVTVSSPDYFRELLHKWSKDPCNEPFSYGDIYDKLD